MLVPYQPRHHRTGDWQNLVTSRHPTRVARVLAELQNHDAESLVEGLDLSRSSFVPEDEEHLAE